MYGGMVLLLFERERERQKKYWSSSSANFEDLAGQEIAKRDWAGAAHALLRFEPAVGPVSTRSLFCHYGGTETSHNCDT